MHNLCNIEDQRLLEQLKRYILSGTTLSIPYPSRRFYIKTDWSKYGMGALLLQTDVSEEARESKAQQKYCGKCEFEKSLEGMHLQPFYFISRSTMSPLENSRHGFVGEADTMRWAIVKFRKYL